MDFRFEIEDFRLVAVQSCNPKSTICNRSGITLGKNQNSKSGKPRALSFRRSRRNPPALSLRQRKKVHLHAAVIMPDHVHLLLTPLCDETGWPYGLPAILKLIKGISARNVNKLQGTAGPIWQEESFDHVLRSQESLKEKQEYIRQNPVRRGLVKKPEDYRWLWVEQGPR